MIINDEIKIIVNPNSRKHYNDLGYHCVNYDEIVIKSSDLPSVEIRFLRVILILLCHLKYLLFQLSL